MGKIFSIIMLISMICLTSSFTVHTWEELDEMSRCERDEYVTELYVERFFNIQAIASIYYMDSEDKDMENACIRARIDYIQFLGSVAELNERLGGTPLSTIMFKN